MSHGEMNLAGAELLLGVTVAGEAIEFIGAGDLAAAGAGGVAFGFVSSEKLAASKPKPFDAGLPLEVGAGAGAGADEKSPNPAGAAEGVTGEESGGAPKSPKPAGA